MENHNIVEANFCKEIDITKIKAGSDISGMVLTLKPEQAPMIELIKKSVEAINSLSKLDGYDSYTHELKDGSEISVFCNWQTFDEILKFINDNEFDKEVDIWWDVNNNFLFWRENPIFESMMEILFQIE